MITKLSERHKLDQNKSSQPIKTSMSIKMSNCSRIVVPLWDFFPVVMKDSLQPALNLSLNPV